MPSVLFLCPHCEKHGEVQVTSVTRSRPCPHCGEPVLLQMGTKDNKRRALLVESPEIGSARAIDKPMSPAYEPQTLEGEVFERMKLDPEVRVFRNKLLFGVAVVVGLIVVAVIADFWLKPVPAVNADLIVTGTATTEDGGELILWEDGLAATQASKREAAEVVVRKFFSAHSADDMLEVVDNPQQWEAAIKRHVLLTPLKPLPVLSMTMAAAGPELEDAMLVRAMLLGGGKAELYVLWNNYKARIDWPSSIGWSAVDWDEFTTKQTREAVTLRVLAEPSLRFEGDFPDSKSLICVKLTNPLRSDSPPLFAYASRMSAEGQGIEFLLRDNGSTVTKLTLSVSYPVNPTRRDQVWIDRVVTAGWYHPASATGAAVSPPSL